jgi:hypothetical protein
MPRGVETSEPLFQGMWHIGYRRDNHLPAFHRDANPLVDAEMRLTGDSGGYADSQVITPLLDIQDGLGHDLPQKECLDFSLYVPVPLVNALIRKVSLPLNAHLSYQAVPRATSGSAWFQVVSASQRLQMIFLDQGRRGP